MSHSTLIVALIIIICSNALFITPSLAAQQRPSSSSSHWMRAHGGEGGGASAGGGCAPLLPRLPRGAVTGSVFKDSDGNNGGGRWRFEEGVLDKGAWLASVCI